MFTHIIYNHKFQKHMLNGSSQTQKVSYKHTHAHTIYTHILRQNVSNYTNGVNFTECELYIYKNKNKGYILNAKSNNKKIFTEYLPNDNHCARLI